MEGLLEPVGSHFWKLRLGAAGIGIVSYSLLQLYQGLVGRSLLILLGPTPSYNPYREDRDAIFTAPKPSPDMGILPDIPHQTTRNHDKPPSKQEPIVRISLKKVRVHTTANPVAYIEARRLPLCIHVPSKGPMFP